MNSPKNLTKVDWGVHNLNDSYIASLLKEYAVMGWNQTMMEMGCSFEIISNALSPSFVKLSEMNETNAFHLADLIWTLKESEEFENYIASSRNRSKESVYSELYFAKLIATHSDSISFNNILASKGKGLDFDLIAKNFKSVSGLNVEKLCIEVKTRSEPFSNQKQVKDYINEARKQLPKNGTGGICILLEGGFFPLKISQEEFDIAIVHSLKQTNRVLFIAYMFIEYEELRDGKRAMIFRYNVLNKEGKIGDFFEFKLSQERPFMTKNTKMTKVT